MRREANGFLIFLTAVTHAAIQACIKKLNTLMETYRLFPGLRLDWLNNVKLERVQSGALHPAPEDTNATYIYAGTVYQVSLSLISKRADITNIFDASYTTSAIEFTVLLTALLLMKLDNLGWGLHLLSSNP